MIYLNTGSHRARDRLAERIGRIPDYYWTWERGGRFALVTDDEAARVFAERRIPGVTKARFKPGEKPGKCWDGTTSQ